MTSHYARGAHAERRVRHQLEAEGWTCIRSAGSHSPADLVCWKDHQLLLVQVKSGRRKASAADKLALVTFAPDLNPQCEVWSLRPRQAPVVEVVRRRREGGEA